MWSELVRRDRPLAVGGGLMALGALGAMVAAAFDDRLVLGINPWIKPMKFFVSVAIFLWTTAWFMPDTRARPRVRAFVRWSIIVAMVVELVLIVLQARRGTTSHFNVATLFDGVVFQVMGMFIVLNTVACVTLLWLVRRDTPGERAGYLWGIRLGLAVFILGSLEAGLMLARNAHTVPGPDGGPGLPIVNWSTSRGDLRIAHFFGIHAMQIVPFVGWCLDSTTLTRAQRSTSVTLFAAMWLALTAALAWLALRGQPIL